MLEGRLTAATTLNQTSLADFYSDESTDIFSKCKKFSDFVRHMDATHYARAHFRLELLGPIDHRIHVRDPATGSARELVCFDSNSYLGLHLHPKVVAAAQQVLADTGLGVPSAQLLSGTHRWLRELEDTVAAFHNRYAAIVFPSGYTANVGALTGLLRRGDFVALDQHTHASVHDGSVWSGATAGVYRHCNMQSLDRVFARAKASRGKLIASDGVFSMYGDLAPLPDLRAKANEHGARLMLDEAHAIGVLGRTGRGLEEHFGLPGSIDVLMGTFSKAPGGCGGYVCGDSDLIDYLRFYARSSMFTASLPPATCAGLTAAFQVMEDEPELREMLWSNTRRLHQGLSQVGFSMSALVSPILTVSIGSLARLLELGRELLEAGIKCGTVSYPAVPRTQSILRFSVNARHRPEDLDRCVEVLALLGRRYRLFENSDDQTSP